MVLTVNTPTQKILAKKNKRQLKKEMSKMCEFGCFICKKYYGVTNTHDLNIHHLRSGVGMGQRNHDQFICLCVKHHLWGPEAIHGIGKKAWEEKFESELSLLQWYKEQVDES